MTGGAWQGGTDITAMKAQNHAAGAIAVHFGFDPAMAMPRLFPGSSGTAIGGLIGG